MDADTVYAMKLVVFSILMGIGIIGVVLRVREARDEKNKENRS